MPIIATTLMMANQNSISPNTFTFKVLIRLTSTKNTTALTHVGTSGHQNCMYLPTAVSSAMPTSTYSTQ